MPKLGVATRRTVPGGSNVSGASVVARKRPILKNPAQIGAKGSATVKVHDLGGEHGLQSYMRLPPEQYSALDPGLITPLGGNRFIINVPRVSFLNIWVEPTAEVTVAQVESPRPAVVLAADSCTIRGSDFLERLRLNDRFTLDMETRLEWECAHDQSGEPGEVAGAAARSASITGSTEFVVSCEVVPPFDLMPRSVLQSTCNVAMTALLRALLPTFIKKLAADFNRWSQEPTYRAERAGWTESQVSE